MGWTNKRSCAILFLNKNGATNFIVIRGNFLLVLASISLDGQVAMLNIRIILRRNINEKDFWAFPFIFIPGGMQ